MQIGFRGGLRTKEATSQKGRSFGTVDLSQNAFLNQESGRHRSAKANELQARNHPTHKNTENKKNVMRKEKYRVLQLINQDKINRMKEMQEEECTGWRGIGETDLDAPQFRGATFTASRIRITFTLW